MKKVFIDGASGTTGLEIRERLRNRTDLELLFLSEEQRKNPAAKREILAQAEVAILCLPDDAAKETVALAQDLPVKILDASTAHRTHCDWTYGLAELDPHQRERIQKARLVANPGCYPTGFLLAYRPLIKQSLVSPGRLVNIHAVSGYSGGGKNMIEEYQKHPTQAGYSFRPYALGMQHKHLPEMQAYALLEKKPLFVPAVIQVERGMLVHIPLWRSETNLRGNWLAEIHQAWKKAYAGESFVQVFEPMQALEAGSLDATACNGTNRVDLMLFGNEDQAVLVARLDNLGKGASGAAVQNLNLMLGLSEHQGLV